MPLTGKNVNQMIGYLLIALIIAGLVYLAYWIFTVNPGRQYPGIEKLRKTSQISRPVWSTMLAGLPGKVARFQIVFFANTHITS